MSPITRRDFVKAAGISASVAFLPASLRAQSACGFRVMGRRARIAQRHGAWRDTIITERRSKIAGV